MNWSQITKLFSLYFEELLDGKTRLLTLCHVCPIRGLPKNKDEKNSWWIALTPMISPGLSTFRRLGIRDSILSSKQLPLWNYVHSRKESEILWTHSKKFIENTRLSIFDKWICMKFLCNALVHLNVGLPLFVRFYSNGRGVVSDSRISRGFEDLIAHPLKTLTP